MTSLNAERRYKVQPIRNGQPKSVETNGQPTKSN